MYTNHSWAEGLRSFFGIRIRYPSSFVNRHTQDEAVREEMNVPVASGSLKLVLSWVSEEA